MHAGCGRDATRTREQLAGCNGVQLRTSCTVKGAAACGPVAARLAVDVGGVHGASDLSAAAKWAAAVGAAVGIYGATEERMQRHQVVSR